MDDAIELNFSQIKKRFSYPATAVPDNAEHSREEGSGDRATQDEWVGSCCPVVLRSYTRIDSRYSSPVGSGRTSRCIDTENEFIGILIKLMTSIEKHNSKLWFLIWKLALHMLG